VIAAWLVHLYTASSAVIAFLASVAVIEHRYRAAFLWLTLAVLVDCTDGVLARGARVSERLPWFSGAKLDDIVDYLTYVFVPALIVWRAILVPDSLTVIVVTAMLLSSAYGFNRADAKTEDHFFTGFPSYWNIVALYLYAAQMRPWVNAAVLLVLSALVFVRIGYVYPSRTPVLRGLTLALCAIWGALVLLMILMLPDVPGVLLVGSLFFPIYYVVLSLALNARRRSR